MTVRVLLVDGREEQIDAQTWTITPEVGLRVLVTDPQGDTDCPVEYHPRFWVRASKGDAAAQATAPDSEDFTGGSGAG